MVCTATLLLDIFRTNLYFRILFMSEKGDVPVDKGPKGKKKESKAVVRENGVPG
jgi:hypothetical protein